MKNVLEIKNLSVIINTVVLLDKINISIPQGSFCVLSGDNGTGKSSLFNLISGYLKSPKNQGEIYLNGNLINGLPPYKIASKGLGRMFQNPRLFNNLSVLENLLVYSKQHVGSFLSDYIFKLSHIKIADTLNRKKALEYLEAFGFADKASEKAEVLSYGQRKLLSLGCLLMAEPILFMLDEPLAGVNKNITQVIFNILQDMNRQGSTIFMIEHNLHWIEHLADQHYHIVTNNRGNHQIVADYKLTNNE